MPQKYFSTFLIGCVLLTACISQPAAPSPTATLTLVPTLTATPTLTPTPTLAPLPQGAIAELAAKLEGTGYRPAWNADQSGFVLKFMDTVTNTEMEVPEITMDTNGNYTRTYMFDNPVATPEEMTVKGKLETITETLEFNKGWKLENGEWVRIKAISPEGKETGIQVYSIEENMQMLRAETQKFVDKYGESVLEDKSDMRSASNSRMRQVLTEGGNVVRNDIIKFGGVNWKVHVPSVENWYWGNNEITFVDSNGKKVGNEPILFNAFTALGNKGEYAFIAWQDVNGKYQEFFIDYSEINEIVVGNYDTYPMKISK